MGKHKVNKTTNELEAQKEEKVVMSVETEMSPERIAQEQQNLTSEDLHDPEVERAKKVLKEEFSEKKESSDTKKEEKVMADDKKKEKDFYPMGENITNEFRDKFNLDINDPKVQEKIQDIAEEIKKAGGKKEDVESSGVFVKIKTLFPYIVGFAAIAGLGYLIYKYFIADDSAAEVSDVGAIGGGVMELITGVA